MSGTIAVGGGIARRFALELGAGVLLLVGGPLAAWRVVRAGRRRGAHAPALPGPEAHPPGERS
jgi:hypothetical protein